MIKLGMLFLLFILCLVPPTLLAQTVSDEVSCTHPQVCRLLKNMSLYRAGAAAPSVQLGLEIKGDPHHFSPGPFELKKLIYTPILVMAPLELAPWQQALMMKRQTEVEKSTLKMELGSAGAKEALTLYTKNNQLTTALAHFWLYPELYCHFKKYLTQELSKLKILSRQDSCPDKKWKEDLAQDFAQLKDYVFVLGHEALLPLFSAYAVPAVSLRKSDDHAEISAEALKKLNDLLSTHPENKVVWIDEDPVQIASWIAKKYRKAGHRVFKINIEGSAQESVEFSELSQLSLKLKSLRPTP